MTASQEKMKIDLSVVSFLQPHIVNPDTYNLAHQGFTREEHMKSDVIKSLEQQRRFKRFLGTWEGRNK